MKLIYVARFTPFEEKENGYTVVFPDLPGCVTEGDTLAEALEMAADAAGGWVLDELEDGKSPPLQTPVTELRPKEKGEILNLVVLDMDRYAERYGSKAVRKNCTLPSWLNERAEKEGINFSEVLKEALTEKLGVR